MLSKFLNKNIKWEKHPKNDRYFIASIDDQRILLRVNDFPDEPLFTLIVGTDILDLDDRPINWKMPYKSS